MGACLHRLGDAWTQCLNSLDTQSVSSGDFGVRVVADDQRFVRGDLKVFEDALKNRLLAGSLRFVYRIDKGGSEALPYSERVYFAFLQATKTGGYQKAILLDLL